MPADAASDVTGHGAAQAPRATTVVIDASALIELVLGSHAGRAVARRIEPDEVTLHAPHLLSLEVAQTLRRLSATGVLSAERAEEALMDAAALDVHHYDHEPIVARVWELRRNLTAYDAVYIALAEVLDAPLLTLDARLDAAPGNHATVELVADG